MRLHSHLRHDLTVATIDAIAMEICQDTLTSHQLIILHQGNQ